MSRSVAEGSTNTGGLAIAAARDNSVRTPTLAPDSFPIPAHLHVEPGWWDRSAKAHQKVERLEHEGARAVLPDVPQRELEAAVSTPFERRARAQGPFAHPILMGTFAASMLPVFIGLLQGAKKQRFLYVLASFAVTAVVLSSGSSGPVMAYLVGIVGWMLWLLRKQMPVLLWGAVCLGVVIHFVREPPVWQLIGRLSSITGGTGYHRSRLIDAFIRNFREWAFRGTDGTAHWGWGLQDATSQYVVEGIGGGIVTLILFLIILRTSFRQLRASRRIFERTNGSRSLFALLAWGSAVAAGAHCVSFISVSYFGQMMQFFIFSLATIPALAGGGTPRTAPKPQQRSGGAGSLPHASPSHI